MKTLEEVIAELEDALQYLREYRERQENLDQFETYQYEQNRPLSWFELRMMDEKPVWLEVKNGERKWTLIWIHPDNVDEIYITDCYGLRGKLNQLMYIRGEIQAYRKERDGQEQ